MSSLGVLFALIPPFQYALDGNFSLKQSRSKQIYKNPDFYFLYLFFITRPKSFIESDLGPPHFFPITTLPERLLLAQGAKQSALQPPPSPAATIMDILPQFAPRAAVPSQGDPPESSVLVPVPIPFPAAQLSLSLGELPPSPARALVNLSCGVCRGLTCN